MPLCKNSVQTGKKKKTNTVLHIDIYTGTIFSFAMLKNILIKKIDNFRNWKQQCLFVAFYESVVKTEMFSS